MQTFIPNAEGIFHGVSFDDYAKAPGISQSMLKAFAAEPTPAHYRESLTRPRVATESMEFGTILHAAILTPHLLRESYYLQPEQYAVTGMKCPSCGSVTDSAKCAKCKCERNPVTITKAWDNRATICDQWTTDHSGRPIINAAKEARIPKIVETVRSLPVVSDILKTGQKEVSFFKNDPETGLLLKCRLDAIATDSNGTTHIADLKKVRRAYATEDRFGIICADLGYDIQAASYLWITGASRFIFVAMEEEAPFEAETFELDPGDVSEGLNKWRKILYRYAETIAEGKWPGYSRTVKRLKLPTWAKDKQRPEAEAIYI